jgi:hypothetical protein
MADYLRTGFTATFSSASPAATSVAGISMPLTPIRFSAAMSIMPADFPVYLTSVNPFAGGVPVQYEVSEAVAQATQILQQSTGTGWDVLTSLSQQCRGGHHVAGTALWHGMATYVSTSLVVLDLPVAMPQLWVAKYTDRPSEYDLLAGELLLDLSGLLDLSDGPYVPSGFIEWGGRKLTDLPAQPITSGVSVAIHQPPKKDDDLIAPWGPAHGQAYTVELPYLTEPPVIVPGDIPAGNSAKVNITVNSVDVIALPGEEPLNVADIRISCDRETFSWQMTCEIRNKGSLDLIKPDVTGYKELAVIINGHRFEFFVPKYSASRKINGDKLDQTWRITGYSRSQYLGQPYAPKRTRSIASTTAVQAATDELFGTGFAVDWDTTLLPDWSMPNSSFSYQDLTPIEVIKRLASVAGGVVLADPASNTLYVRPKYPAAAWHLLGADMDRTIYESQILGESMDSAEKPLFNSVLVAGESEGVALTVKRLGTAGDNPAPDITESWLTAIEGNTSRGTAELSASGNRQTYTLDLAVPETSAQPGLLIPGLMVGVLHDDPANNYRAYVDAINISVPGRSNATVIQTVTLDRPAGWEAA